MCISDRASMCYDGEDETKTLTLHFFASSTLLCELITLCVIASCVGSAPTDTADTCNAWATVCLFNAVRY